jgi:DNA polymerase-3 subunit alpha
MVYQEQVMQIAQAIGGYTLGQADILRRAMGKKNKDEMLAQKKRFVDGAVERGVSLDIAERLFEQMNKFAGYGFNKSHSTPYGLLTYQTAFLKANYKMEFFAAIMTLDMGNTDKLYAYYQDAQKNGATIIPPHINESESDFIIDYPKNAIVYSLAAIKGSGEYVVNEIVKERKANGLYQSIFDLVERLEPKKILNRRFMENFIKSGAFDKLHPNRRQLLESLDLAMSVKSNDDQGSLFEKSYPQLLKVDEWNETEKLQNEFSAIGFYISNHPIRQYEEELKRCHFLTIAEAKEVSKARVVAIINDYSFKKTKTQSRFCVLQVSDASGVAEVSMFSETLANCRDLIAVGNIVSLDLSCSKNEEQTRMFVEKMQKFDPKNMKGNKPLKSFAIRESSKPASLEKTFQIKIKSKEELIAVKNLIDNFKKNGNYSIELSLPEKISLPDKYDLSQYDILDLRRLVGADNAKVI